MLQPRCSFSLAIIDLPFTQSDLHAELPDQVVQDAVDFMPGLRQYDRSAITTFECGSPWRIIPAEF